MTTDHPTDGPGQTAPLSRRGIVRGAAASALARQAPAAAQATPEAQPPAGEPRVWWTANSPFLKGVMTAPNQEPAIPHPDRDAAAGRRLAVRITLV